MIAKIKTNAGVDGITIEKTCNWLNHQRKENHVVSNNIIFAVFAAFEKLKCN